MENTQIIKTEDYEEMSELPTLKPLSPAEAKQMMVSYQEYVKALLDESDYQDIQGKQFKKKSAWRKLAMAGSISVQIIDERREELPNGDFAYHFNDRATHPNGRVMSGTGSCTAYEKALWKDGKWMTEKSIYESGRFVGKKWVEATPNTVHNVRSTAETRASNRAISNLIAAGEVSADEIVDDGPFSHYNALHTPSTPSSVSTAPKRDYTFNRPAAQQSPKEIILGVCTTCGKTVSEKEHSYSQKRYGKVLCFNHQNV